MQSISRGSFISEAETIHLEIHRSRKQWMSRNHFDSAKHSAMSKVDQIGLTSAIVNGNLPLGL